MFVVWQGDCNLLYILSELNLSFFYIIILRELRHERLGQQLAQWTAAASQKPGWGHSGGHPQHHPWNHHWQLWERPLSHYCSSNRQTSCHQQDQVRREQRTDQDYASGTIYVLPLIRVKIYSHDKFLISAQIRRFKKIEYSIKKTLTF